MENSITLPQNNIFKDAARSFVYSEIEKIESILNQNYQDFIKDKCRQMKIHLNLGIEKIQDRADLMDFKLQINFVSQLLDLFLTSSESKSSWWAMALIKECYEKCGIDYSSRNILIVHYLNSKNYSVCADLLSISPIKQLKDPQNPIDVFIIPSEARYDVASIALIGHEVGHIYWKQNYDSIVQIIEDTFDNQYGQNSTLFDLENLKLKRAKIASHIEEFLCDKIGRFLLGPAFDFALLKYFIAFQHNHSSSITHPPENTRMEESLDSLKNYNSTSTEIKKCFTNLIEYFPDIQPSLPFENEDDKFARGLAESIHSTSSFQNGYDEMIFINKWNEIIPELDAFRPPFEKVVVN